MLPSVSSFGSTASGAATELVASLFGSRGAAPSPQRQAAFAEWTRDALQAGNVSVATLAVQALQGFIDGNG